MHVDCGARIRSWQVHEGFNISWTFDLLYTYIYRQAVVTAHEASQTCVRSLVLSSDQLRGNSEVKTKAELGSLKPSEMIPDNLPDGATDSN